MRIIIHDQEYIIDEFINDHPGGSHVFKDGRDQTTEFDDANHSAHAIQLMTQYNVNKEAIYVENKPKTSFGDRVKAKLFTKMDRLYGTRHLHKTFGLLNAICCGIFLYNSFINGCTGELTLSPYIISTMAIVGVLPGITAALTFDVGKEISDNVVGINKMFLGHNLGFTFRSVTNILACCYFGENSRQSFIVGCVGALFFGQLADYVSLRFNDSKSKTTVQNLVNCSTTIPPIIISIVKNIYIYAQLYFTAWCCKPSIAGQFVGMYGLLFTAFFSTLNRTGFINNNQWNILYLLIYFVGGMSVYKRPDVTEQLAVGLIAFLLRVQFNMKKSYIWGFYGLFVVLPYYSATASAIVIIALTNKHMFEPARVETYNKIVQKQQIASDKWLIGIKMTSIKMTSVDGYKPGMYYNLYCGDQKRPYTPLQCDGNILRFYIKAYSHQGAMSLRFINNHLVGNNVTIRGPFGRKWTQNGVLYVNEKAIEQTNILFISCGTGATPFVSILTNNKYKYKYKFKWLHAGEDERPIINRNDVVYFNATNRLDQTTLESHKQVDQRVFVCGTDAFVELVKQTYSDAIVY